MLEENFLSSWLREDGEDKEDRRRKVNKETSEEVSRRGKREGDKGEDETVAKRRCINFFFFGDAIEKFSQGGIRIVVGILGVIFWVTLVVCLIMCRRCRRVCLL